MSGDKPKSELVRKEEIWKMGKMPLLLPFAWAICPHPTTFDPILLAVFCPSPKLPRAIQGKLFLAWLGVSLNFIQCLFLLRFTTIIKRVE
jgi:hypothetical protein